MPGKLMNFDLPKGQSSIIKVIGVGGGGSNAVNHMFSQGIKGVDFVVCNTDSQALDFSPVPHKIQLGAGLTEGLGAGGDPNVGKNSALENIEQIKEILETNTQMVFVTAGMGGGTGTGGAPVIASIAKEMNILTVGIVTIPFSNEGPKRMEQAEEGLDKLRESVDALIIICNDKLREMYGNLTLSTAFLQADNVLATAARGIAEMISVHGTINVDFRDVSTVMKDSGVAIMGSAIATGDDRAVKAVEMALASPLLNDNKITGARYVLLNITTGVEEPLLDEITDISDFVQQEAGNIANVIMGVSTDEAMEDSLGVTIIAAGFDTNPDLGFVGAKQPERVVRDLNEPAPSRPTIVHQLDETEGEPESIKPEATTLIPPLVEAIPVVFPPMSPPSAAKEENLIEDTPERKVFELKMDDDEDMPTSKSDEDDEMKLVVKEDLSSDLSSEASAKEETPSKEEEIEEVKSQQVEDLFEQPMASYKEESTETPKEEEPEETVEATVEEVVEEETPTATEEEVTEIKEDETPEEVVEAKVEDVKEDVSSEALAKEEPKMDEAAKKKQAELDAILNKFPAPPPPKKKEDEPKDEVEAKENEEIEKQETVGKAEDNVEAKEEDVSSVTSTDAKEEEIEEANIPEFKLMGDSEPVEEEKTGDFEFDLSTDTEAKQSLSSTPLSEVSSEDDVSGSSSLSEGESNLSSFSSPNSMDQSERISKLKELSYKLRTPSGVSDLEDQPAYMRRKVDLDDVPHSSESEVSRFSLEDSEGGEDKVELKPDNPFLHDNVD